MPVQPKKVDAQGRPAAKGSMPKANTDLIAKLDGIAAVMAAHRKPMFGTVAWFLDANAQMFLGVWGEDINVRVGEAEAQRFIAAGSAREFSPMQGRTMREYVLVAGQALRDADLRKWARRGLAFAETLPLKKGK